MRIPAGPGVAMSVLATALLSGCQHGKNLTAAGEVTVQPVSTKTVRVVWAEAWQDGEYTVVRGGLMRRGISAYPLTGHVDVRFVDADGHVVRHASSREVGIRRSTPGKGPRLSPFELRLKFRPAAGSTAVVAYHAGAHER